MIRTVAVLAPLAMLVACNNGAGEGAPASSPATSGDAPTLLGEWAGTITRGDAETEDHTIEFLDHADGQLQLGLQEFCNIDLEGAAPSWSSVEGASCLVDVGDGRNATNVTASVRLEGDTVLLIATFDGGQMWSFEGTR